MSEAKSRAGFPASPPLSDRAERVIGPATSGRTRWLHAGVVVFVGCVQARSAVPAWRSGGTGGGYAPSAL